MDSRKTFVVVVLLDANPRELIVIPSKWIYELNIITAFNQHGVDACAERKIFYSNDFLRVANFRLPTRRFCPFDKHVDACYRAKIKGSFGK